MIDRPLAWHNIPIQSSRRSAFVREQLTWSTPGVLICSFLYTCRDSLIHLSGISDNGLEGHGIHL